MKAGCVYILAARLISIVRRLQMSGMARRKATGGEKKAAMSYEDDEAESKR